MRFNTGKLGIDRIPTTDEEVEVAFGNLHHNDAMIVDLMKRIYSIHREQGESLLDAYAATLRASVGEK